MGWVKAIWTVVNADVRRASLDASQQSQLTKCEICKWMRDFFVLSSVTFLTIIFVPFGVCFILKFTYRFC